MVLLAQQMAERRERILAAAREIIGRRGYEALTMRELARAARVTVPTVYNLVGSKEQVLLAAVEEQVASFLAGVDRVDAKAPAERVLAVVDACVDELLRLPLYYRSLLHLLYASDAAADARAQVGRALTRPLDRALVALAASGELAGWVDPATLLARLRAHLQFSSLQWASGELDDAGLRDAARYEAALGLLGVTQGRSRAVFETAARAAQPGAPRRDASAGPRHRERRP